MLNKTIAQDIVNRMMEIIPYNVNIMNDKGVIIASGDESRIGISHKGAIYAIINSTIIETDYHDNGVKPGVNIPIMFKKKIIGVIGITGNPEDVRQFGKLVSVTAELLINQEYNMNQYITKKRLKEEFIYEWLYCNSEYDTELIDRGNSININISTPRILAIIESKDNSFTLDSKFLWDGEFSVNISPEKIVLILDKDHKVYRRLESLKERHGNIIRIAVGTEQKIIINSMMEAIEALNIGKKLFSNEQLYIYEKMNLLCKGQELFRLEECMEIIRKIDKDSKDSNLLGTFLELMKNNGEKNKTAEKLFIHRNTLNYRIEKIQEITSLNFNNYIDLFQFISAYVSYKLKN